MKAALSALLLLAAASLVAGKLSLTSLPTACVHRDQYLFAGIRHSCCFGSLLIMLLIMPCFCLQVDATMPLRQGKSLHAASIHSPRLIRALLI